MQILVGVQQREAWETSGRTVTRSGIIYSSGCALCLWNLTRGDFYPQLLPSSLCHWFLHLVTDTRINYWNHLWVLFGLTHLRIVEGKVWESLLQLFVFFRSWANRWSEHIWSSYRPAAYLVPTCLSLNPLNMLDNHIGRNIHPVSFTDLLRSSWLSCVLICFKWAKL